MVNQSPSFKRYLQLLFELHAANLKDEDLDDTHYDEMGDLWYSFPKEEADGFQQLSAYLNWKDLCLPKEAYLMACETDIEGKWRGLLAFLG